MQTVGFSHEAAHMLKIGTIVTELVFKIYFNKRATKPLSIAIFCCWVKADYYTLYMNTLYMI